MEKRTKTKGHTQNSWDEEEGQFEKKRILHLYRMI
jgi:hypothetical protein